jgi:hypothetical protein
METPDEWLLGRFDDGFVSGVFTRGLLELIEDDEISPPCHYTWNAGTPHPQLPEENDVLHPASRVRRRPRTN